MSSDAVAVAATRAYQAQLERFSGVLGTQLETMWREFIARGRKNKEDLFAWRKATGPVFDAVGSAVSVATDAYGSLLLDEPIAGVNGAIYARLAPPDDPYFRLWKDLGSEVRYAEAVDNAASVAFQLGVEAVQSTARNTFGKRNAGVTRWKRVLTGESCIWCSVVSTQTYRSQESATFGHDNCDCTVVPITEKDPGRYINRELYDRLREDGVMGKVSEGSAPRRLEAQTVNAARRRDEWLAKAFLTDSSGEKYEIYLDRARSWDQKSKRYAADAAKSRARVQRAVGTGYVNPTGAPVPRP